ncbi:MAG: acetate--CoA ligase family protein, partial [Ignavibacteria bacterium]|nr:acetate--CoA ligase family protein [Ignavibacteria bacterium]
PKVYCDTDKNKVQDINEKALTNNRTILNSQEVYSILEAYGINVAPWNLLPTVDSAVSAAEAIGYPVVLKADSEKIIHKSDSGGVVLNLKNSDELRKAANTMAENFNSDDLKFFVQKFLPGGKEVIIGATSEPGLGHLIMFGMGGVFVELLKDVAFCLTPVSRPEAKEMTESIKTAKILTGYRGDKGVDIPGLIEIIQRISQLVTENPQIGELDLNPVAAFESNVVVVDARIKLQNI